MSGIFQMKYSNISSFDLFLINQPMEHPRSISNYEYKLIFEELNLFNVALSKTNVT